mgnify:CR=1 FL=1
MEATIAKRLAEMRHDLEHLLSARQQAQMEIERLSAELAHIDNTIHFRRGQIAALEELLPAASPTNNGLAGAQAAQTTRHRKKWARRPREVSAPAGPVVEEQPEDQERLIEEV